jgi:hypothetical protein
MRVLSVPPLLLVLLAGTAGCGKDTGGGGPGGDASPSVGGDLTVDHPGAQDTAEARRRAAEHTVSRTSEGLELTVWTDPTLEPSWVELTAPGTSPVRWGPRSQGPPRPVFVIPGRTSGPVVVRIAYPGGDVWRRTLDL